MVEYIDKNGAIKILEKYRLELSSTYSAGLTTAKNAIKGIPTEDVVPRSAVEEWYAEYHKVKEDLKQEKMYHRATEKLADRYLIELNQTKQEIEKLSIELEAMRGAANSYKMHYENAKQEVAREIFEEIEKALAQHSYAQCFQGEVCATSYFDYDLEDSIAELKKKYIGE